MGIKKSTSKPTLDAEDRKDVAAWLANQSPMDGVIFGPDVQSQIDRGREAIERLRDGAAISAREVADIVTFMHSTEPHQPLNPQSLDSPNLVCGQMHVLEAIEGCLRQPFFPFEGPSPIDLMTIVQRAHAIVRAVVIAQERGDDDADAFQYALDEVVDILERAGSDLSNLQDAWERKRAAEVEP